ncbi:MAG: hypothetical protein V1911_03995 [Candidatus Micrarchaeota archaeon]
MRDSKRIRFAIEKKLEIQKDIKESNKLIDRYSKRYAGRNDKLFETITGVKPLEKIEAIRTPAGIIFSVENKDFHNSCKMLDSCNPSTTGGFIVKNPKLPLFRGRVAIINPTGGHFKTNKARLAFKERTLKHEGYHLKSGFASKTAYFGFSRLLMDELGAAIEEDRSIKDVGRWLKKRMNAYININKKQLPERPEKFRKESIERINLVENALKRGIPQSVLAGIMITSNWQDLPTTLRKLFGSRKAKGRK